MTTNELIEFLKRNDPSGKAVLLVDGQPIIGADLIPEKVMQPDDKYLPENSWRLLLVSATNQ